MSAASRSVSIAATVPSVALPFGATTVISDSPATAWATVATSPSATTTPTARVDVGRHPVAPIATTDALGSGGDRSVPSQANSPSAPDTTILGAQSRRCETVRAQKPG